MPPTPNFLYEGEDVILIALRDRRLGVNFKTSEVLCYGVSCANCPMAINNEMSLCVLILVASNSDLAKVEPYYRATYPELFI